MTWRKAETDVGAELASAWAQSAVGAELASARAQTAGGAELASARAQAAGGAELASARLGETSATPRSLGVREAAALRAVSAGGLALALVLSPVGPAAAAPAGPDEAVSGAPAITEWQSASPESQGLDPQHLARGVERIGRLRGARSLLVVRNGRIVAEESFAGSELNRRPHDVKSASKSLLSALVGVALEKGWIGGLESSVAELLPGYSRSLEDGKRRITLAHLLTMSSGLASTSRQHYGAWVATGDWTAAALEGPLVAEPGEEFTYSTGNSHLVSAILTEAGGASTLELVREHLLEPLGMKIHAWQRSPEGYYFGGNNLRMTPRDLARLGQLYLQDGRWNGRQVVSAEWVERSTRRHAEGWPDRYGAYGYFWWLPPDDPWDSFAAIGYGGQFLYAVPELQMLVVMTSTLESKGEEWDQEAFAIFREDLFGAVKTPD